MLSVKHEHFAQLVSNSESPPKAYVLAGYSANGADQSAYRLLKNANICERIAQLRTIKESEHKAVISKVIAESGVDKAWVMAKLVKIVDMGMQAEPVLDSEGAAIGVYKQNLASSNKALELIGKELMMFIDRSEVRTGPLDGIEHEELKAIRDAISTLATPGGLIAASTSSTRH